ncbi:MAG: hypothetical protein JSS57_13455 [Proteobacteria bacterium]|nr:hypothetical protein [Pseudomonadota bacterium]
MPKNYTVREGYVVVLATKGNDDKIYERTFIGGDNVRLDDDQAQLHLHKLEFADAADRKAALDAEAAERAKTQAANPAQLIADLVAALSVAQQAGAASAPAATPAEA